MNPDRQHREMHYPSPKALVKPIQHLVKGRSNSISSVHQIARKNRPIWQACLTSIGAVQPLRLALTITLALAGIKETVNLPLESGILNSWQTQRVNAQTISPVSESEVRRYAQAVLAIEPLRQNAYNTIQQLLGNAQVPSIACHHQNVIPSSLPNAETVRQIVRNYCDRSTEIVSTNGLSIARFNEITMQLRGNPVLQQRVQAELIRLQQFPSNP